MILTFKNNFEYCSEELFQEFAKWLVEHIKYSLYAQADNKQLTKFDKYLKALKLDSKRILTSKQGIICAANNLDINISNNICKISINENQKIPNFSVKVSTVAKLLNFGCLTCSGTFIFSKTFDYFKNNIQKLWNRFVGAEWL